MFLQLDNSLKKDSRLGTKITKTVLELLNEFDWELELRVGTKEAGRAGKLYEVGEELEWGRFRYQGDSKNEFGV